MKRSNDASVDAPTHLALQAHYNRDVQQRPDTGNNRSALQPGPTVSVADARQAITLLSLFFSQQQESGTVSILSALSDKLSASRPVLLGPAAAEPAAGSGNRQMGAPDGLAPPAPGPASGEPVPASTGSTSVEQGTEAALVQAALDGACRSELSEWVQCGNETEQAARQEAKNRVYSYLAKPAGQRRGINLEGLRLLTVPPLPTDLIQLDLRLNELTILPEHFPTSLQALKVNYNKLIYLPKNLPPGLQVLNVDQNRLTALPMNLPDGLQELHVSFNRLTALPERLPSSLRRLCVSNSGLNALPMNLPQRLQELDVGYNNLTALPQHLPPSLERLDVSLNNLTALPQHLPPRLQVLKVRQNMLKALPQHLPNGLRELDVNSNHELTALPAHLPQSLESLSVQQTGLHFFELLLALLGTNTSITALDYYGYDSEGGRWPELDQKLLDNKRAALIPRAAAALDLLTRFGFTTSDETGMLTGRGPTPDTVAGQLPGQPIPCELHDVLAANCHKEVLAVLAGMVGGAAQ